MEDAVPSTAKHGTARGIPMKEVLEFAVPELSVNCLRLGLNTPKVTDQLMKLDEQGVSITLFNLAFFMMFLFYILFYERGRVFCPLAIGASLKSISRQFGVLMR